MRTKLYPIIVVMLLTVLFVGSAVAQTGPPVQDDAPPIRLWQATFTPARGERPRIPSRLRIGEYAAQQRGYYIVQFRGPVRRAWKDQITARGAEILEYVPDFAFKVRMAPEEADQVGRLDSVIWVGIFHPAYKLGPNLARNGSHLYSVRIAEGAPIDPVVDAVTRLGAPVSRRGDSHLLVAAKGRQLEAVARILDVAWIESFQIREKQNDYGAGVIMGADMAHINGYVGLNQVVAVADTGLGDGTEAGAHPDIPATRIDAIHNWSGANSFCWNIVDDGAQDADSGHGTHTSGSVLSGGGLNGQGRGTAPDAHLVFQATENYVDFTSICELFYGYQDGYYLIGLPEDIRDLFQEAYDSGARIHSNSWGSDVKGEYTDDAANTDDFMWTHPDMLVTTSAGNAGTDNDADGAVDDDSIGSPATAKNILTVGASEHDRQGHYECDEALTYTSSAGDSCQSLGGSNEIFSYGEAWPDDFQAEPIASDPAAGDAEQMAAFSSRGPTDDGRIKPDLVAPGTYVLSNYSGLYQEGYDPSPNPQNDAWQYDGWGFPLDEQYKYMGGTSMSNPLVAGAAAVVRDFYDQEHSHDASAALVKAALINSAVDMLDENNDGVDDNAYPIPNSHEGWGRADVANATDGSREFVDETTGLATGGTVTYQFDVDTAGDRFKVTLVWTDYPGSTSASKALVNDLDLVVTAPDGTTYRGNVFSGGWSVTAGSADRINNVENVYVQSAQQGTWDVSISGYNVPQGPQPFALVVDGALGEADPRPTVQITSPSHGDAVTGVIDVTADASDDTGVSQVEFFVDGTSIGTDTDGSDGWSTSWDTTGSSDGLHQLTATATDTVGQTGSDTIDVTVDNTPPAVSITHPAEGEAVAGTIEVVVDAGDAATQVSQVAFFVDGVSIGTDTDGSDGWSTSWDTTGTTDGGHTLTATATDGVGLTAESAGVNVTVDNTPPTVSITSPADGTTVSGITEVTADASDGTGEVAHVEFLVNGNSIGTDTDSSDGWSVSWDTTTVENGSHSLTAVATDAAGNAATSSSVVVTVENESITMHIGDLDGSSRWSWGTWLWLAEVTIEVHNTNHGPVSDATVSGTWSNGYSGSAQCTTDGNGRCTISTGSIWRSSTSATFTVDNVAHATLGYQPASNHDPDADSDGTTIVVSRP